MATDIKFTVSMDPKTYHSIDVATNSTAYSTQSIQSISSLLNHYETTKQRFDLSITAYLIVLLGGITFCLIFFYRGSLSPIVDVLEQELDATASQIGQMSSLFYAGYTIMQIPSGFALEIVTAELVIVTAGLGFAIASLLFSLSQQTLYASVIWSIAGILGSPVWLACLALIGQRMGNNQVPLWSGIVLFYTYFFLLGITTLQAYLWDKHHIWREVYYVLSGLCLLISLIFIVLNLCDNRHNGAKLLTDEPVKQNQRSRSCLRIFRERDASSKPSMSVIKVAFCNPWNYVIGLYLFSVAAIVYGFNGLWLIPFLMNKYGYDRTFAAVVCNLFYISSAIGGLIMGKLSTKYKKRKIFMIMASLMLSSSALIVHLGSDTNVVVIVTLNCVAGCGAGIFGVAFAVVREYNVYYNCADIAGGLANSIGSLAGFVFPFAIGFLMDVHWIQSNGKTDGKNGKRMYSANDYEFAFISIDIAIGFMFLVSLIVKETNGEMVEFKGKK